MGLSSPDPETALLDEHLKREKLLLEALALYLKVVPTMLK